MQRNETPSRSMSFVQHSVKNEMQDGEGVEIEGGEIAGKP